MTSISRDIPRAATRRRGEMIMGGRQTPALGSALPYVVRRRVHERRRPVAFFAGRQSEDVCIVGLRYPGFLQQTPLPRSTAVIRMT